MKKDVLTHFSFLAAFFIFISLFRNWLSLAFLPFWLGGIFGTLLPDVDYLLHIYFLKPEEATSQEVSGLIAKRKFVESWDLVAKSRLGGTNLTVHTVYFQLMFLVFAFLVVTSSTSLFGQGLVLAFLLHLLVDQAIDYVEEKNLDSWFAKFPFSLTTDQKRWYLIANFVVFLILGFLL